MLKKHLISVPPTKFVLVKDSLKHRSKSLVEFLIGNHIKRTIKVHCFIFESVSNKRHKNNLGDDDTDTPGIVYHDFSKDPNGWLEGDKKSFEKELASIADNCVIVVDSLVHAIYYYGLSELISVISRNLSRPNFQQLIATLHGDLLSDPKIEQYLQHLSTLFVNLDEKTQTVQYTYKKIGGKIEKGIEQYVITDGDLTMKPVSIADLSAFKHEKQEILPESLTTFKIALDDKARESKEKLILPYLPKNVEETGKISYEFDNVDDWDEEDPDDDLDI